MTFKEQKLFDLINKGDKILNNYKILKTLGVGSFAKVKLAVREILGYKEYFAVKVMKKSVLKKKRNITRDAETGS